MDATDSTMRATFTLNTDVDDEENSRSASTHRQLCVSFLAKRSTLVRRIVVTLAVLLLLVLLETLPLGQSGIIRSAVHALLAQAFNQTDGNSVKRLDDRGNR